MRNPILLSLALFLPHWGAAAPTVHADDAYFSVPINRLRLTEGKLNFPTRRRPLWGDILQRGFRPRIILDVPGEAYSGRKAAQPYVFGSFVKHPEDHIVVRAESGKDVRGRFFFPKKDWSGMDVVRFEIPASEARISNRDDFLRVKQFHYEYLRAQQVSGNAWFRYQLQKIAEQRGEPLRNSGQFRTTGFGEFYTGTRAISENLALDRLLTKPEDAPLTEDPEKIPGITIQEFDWDNMTPDNKPIVDPLASLLPHDQYAVFFHDFNRFTALIDEVAKHGVPFAESISPSIQDRRTLSKYETQLCLSLGQAARLLGPQVVKSVAITGSDLYLRDGSEVAILFETGAADVLQASIVAQQNLVLESTRDCERRSGKIGELEWTCVVSPGNRISSWVAKSDGTVIVTNAKRQIERFAKLVAATEPSLASLGEYRHFRGRYQRDAASETAFIMLTDATIRNWCSAVERIAVTRRVHAGAMLSDLTAIHMDEIVRGIKTPRAITSKFYVPEQGRLMLTADGIVDSQYGSLGRLVPVAQLHPHLVAKSEATAYTNWRRNFERNFRNAFDPIGIRLSVGRDSLGVDMTIMPLKVNSSYRWLVRDVQQDRIDPQSGDRHPGNILNMTLPGKSFFRSLGSILSGGHDHKLEDEAGPTMSFYLDDSPFWNAMLESPDFSVGLNNINAIPAAVRFDLKNPDKFPQLMTALVNQQAGNDADIRFEARDYKGMQWFQLKSDRAPWSMVKDQFGYVVLPEDKEVHISLNQKMIEGAIDRYVVRQKIRAAGQPIQTHGPDWLGESVGLQVRWPAGVMDALFASRTHNLAVASWGNLDILNEWKSRYPDEDSLQLHERVWKETLACPGGGKYVWNAEFKTHESTVFGHPARPKFPAGVKGDRWTDRINRGNFGLTIEENGLRAIVEIR